MYVVVCIHSPDDIRIVDEKTIKNPLIVAVGIGEYDGMKNLGTTTDYAKIKHTFNFRRGYSIVYQDRNENIRCIRKRCKSANHVLDQFKLRWSEADIENFNDHIVEKILNENSWEEYDSDDSSSDSDDEDDDDNKESKIDTNQIKVNEKYDALIYFLSCHGASESIIYDSEGTECYLSFIFDKFEYCSYLRGLPKIYFLDHCRGSHPVKRKANKNGSKQNVRQKNYDEEKVMNGNDDSVTTSLRGGGSRKQGIKKEKNGVGSTYIPECDTYKIFATRDGYATVDAGRTGGYLIQSVAAVFEKNELFAKEFGQIRNHISQLMESKMGKNANSPVNVMEFQSTVNYPIKFEERK